jgi:hypothetical protein
MNKPKTNFIKFSKVKCQFTPKRQIIDSLKVAARILLYISKLCLTILAISFLIYLLYVLGGVGAVENIGLFLALIAGVLIASNIQMTLRFWRIKFLHGTIFEDTNK